MLAQGTPRDKNYNNLGAIVNYIQRKEHNIADLANLTKLLFRIS